MKKISVSIVSILVVISNCIAQGQQDSLPGNLELVSSKKELIALASLERKTINIQ